MYICIKWKKIFYGILFIFSVIPYPLIKIFILSIIFNFLGLRYKHLFLESEERNLVETLKIEFIESGDAPLEAAGNVASVARLLIVFFEELPEPLIPVSSQPDFISGMESKL